MKVQETLSKKKEAIERELEQILSGSDSRLYQAMKYAVMSGGKRFRPLLLLSSGGCFRVPEPRLLPFACGLELIHTYSLVHDDLPSMDNDDFRRGKPSCHRAFGEDVALLAGDALLTLAFEVMAEAPVPRTLTSQKEEAVRLISRMAGGRGMIEGQYMDITLSRETTSGEDLRELIRKKTGALITAAVVTGAILGKARISEREALEKYANNVGIAFQIRDDILDSGETGGKDGLKSPNFVDSHGLDEAKKRLGEYVKEALQSLEEADLHSEQLRFLALKLLEIEGGR